MSKDKAISVLNSGGVIVMATDTIYGICAKASCKSAVEKLYLLKNRFKKPGTVISGSVDDLLKLGIKRRYITPIEHYWPDSLSVVLPTGQNLSYLDQGVGTLAVRVVPDKWLSDLLKETGPLLTSSANLPEQSPAEDIVQAKKYFGEKIDYYWDKGKIVDHKPSTIIRVIDDAIVILRKGAVDINEKGEKNEI